MQRSQFSVANISLKLPRISRVLWMSNFTAMLTRAYQWVASPAIKVQSIQFKTLILNKTFSDGLTLAAATATSVGATGLSRMVSKDLNHQFIGRLLELVNHSVVQRVLVLLKPASEVVRHLNWNRTVSTAVIL
jgi:hypothetical protein